MKWRREGGREGGRGGGGMLTVLFPWRMLPIVFFNFIIALLLRVWTHQFDSKYILFSPDSRFQLRGGRKTGGGGGDDDYVKSNSGTSSVVYQSSIAFSIMCIFVTVMYAAFACLIFYNSYALLEESVADARDDGDGDRNKANTAPGYFGGDRFGVVGRTYGDYGRGEKPIEVL